MIDICPLCQVPLIINTWKYEGCYFLECSNKENNINQTYSHSSAHFVWTQDRVGSSEQLSFWITDLVLFGYQPGKNIIIVARRNHVNASFESIWYDNKFFNSIHDLINWIDGYEASRIFL